MMQFSLLQHFHMFKRSESIFFRSKQPDGKHTNPRDYIDTPNAQSFLNFGEKPDMNNLRDSYNFYSKNIDGKDVQRIISFAMLVRH